MKKSILVISQYFWPEKFHINNVCEELKHIGHRVQILTGKPNYPFGKIFKGYKKEGNYIEKYKNIDVFRVPLQPRKKSTSFDLLRNYLSFIINASYYGLKFKFAKFDTILFFGTSPITSAIPAIFFKLLYKKKLILWVQDLWPQSLMSTGHIKNQIILKFVNYIVKFIYYFSDKILIQSILFEKYISKQTNKKKLLYLPNSFKIPKSKLKLKFNHEELLKKNFCITFAWNIGKAQDLNTLIMVAKNLQKIKKLKIIIIGDGSDKQKLKKIVALNKIKNVYFLGSYNQDYVYEIYKKSSSLYVSLKNDKTLNLTIPYKLQSYLSAGKIVIGAVSGITKKIITNNKLGFCCKNNNLKRLEHIILKVYNLSNKEKKIIEKNSYNYFKKNFELKNTVKKLSNLINDKV
jgi:glycosyltransferase involved in cell wall biosynthesis